MRGVFRLAESLPPRRSGTTRNCGLRVDFRARLWVGRAGRPAGLVRQPCWVRSSAPKLAVLAGFLGACGFPPSPTAGGFDSSINLAIRDARDGRPLLDATVAITRPGHKTGFRSYGRVDSVGSVRLSGLRNEQYLLRVTRIGFVHKDTVLLASPTPIQHVVTLRPDTLSLDAPSTVRAQHGGCHARAAKATHITGTRRRRTFAIISMG